MLDFGVVEGDDLRGALKAHDVRNAVEVRYGAIGPRQKAAALIGIELPGVSHHVVEDRLRNDEVGHDQIVQVTV